jgi:O-antigen ligase
MAFFESTSRRRHGSSPASARPESTDRFLRTLVFFPLVLLPLLFGGARPWIWQGVTGLFFIALAVWHVRHELTFPWRTMRAGLIAAACLLCVPALQALPMPAAVQGLLSPVRAVWTAGLREYGSTFSTALSYDPLATWMHLAWWAFLAVFACLLYQAMAARESRYPTWLLHGLFLLAGFEALYGILQALIPTLGVLWDIDPRTGLAYKGYARGTFINRNHFAAFLGLVWPLLLAYLLILKTPRRMEFILGKRAKTQELQQKKAFGVFCLGLVILGLFFSQSRGGILAAVLAFTLLYFFAGMRQKRVTIVLVGCWAVMLAYGALIGFEGISNRFERIDKDFLGRYEIWKDGWTAVMDHPLTGTGLGTYPAVGRAYQNAIAPQLRAHHAHNDYLETAVEMGLPAAGALILGIWGLWWYRAALLWRGRKTMDPDRLLLAAASLAALGGYLLHAWVEFNNAIPANQLTAIMVAVFHFGILREAPETATVRQEALGRPSTEPGEPVLMGQGRA